MGLEKGQSVWGREMVVYLRCNLLLATTSPPGLEAHVGGVELNRATRLQRGLKVEALTLYCSNRSIPNV